METKSNKRPSEADDVLDLEDQKNPIDQTIYVEWTYQKVRENYLIKKIILIIQSQKVEEFPLIKMK